MKKLILILTLIAVIVTVNEVKAQGPRGTNGMSDQRVTLPVITPQVTPSVALNAVNVPTTIVPAIPPVPVLSMPAISPMPSISAPNLLPSIPTTPPTPAAPTGGVQMSAGTFTTSLTLPMVPMLPPIPPIPPMPDIRLRIGAQ